MFSNKFIVIHFESMVVGNTKAVGNWFMKVRRELVYEGEKNRMTPLSLMKKRWSHPFVIAKYTLDQILSLY
jgi:hypothetical protein